MAKEVFVLCRRVVSDPLETPKRFCGVPITTKNSLDWCAMHLSKVPIWPDDSPETASNSVCY